MIIVGLCVLMAPAAKAESPKNNWGGIVPSLVKRVSAPQLPFTGDTCAGSLLPIAIDGVSDYVEACVFGEPDGVRVARYLNENSVFRYAISYKLDTEYFAISNLCLGMRWCVYGQEADVFLIDSRIVSHFTQRLTRHEAAGVRSYVFDENGNDEYLHAGTTVLPTGSMGVSENGQWAVIEARDVGYIRINLDTLEFKRIYPLSLTYGYGFDPLFEMSISNDGANVVVTGRNAGIDVFEVSDECGDHIAQGLSTFFLPTVTPCQSASIDRFTQFPGFAKAQMPRFSRSGTLLTMIVQSSAGTERVAYTSDPLVTGTTPLYVAFGDSYTSGEGELRDSFYMPQTNTAENKCHVSTRSYPMLVGELWSLPVINAACSGATTQEMRKAKDELGQFPTIISLSIGGNDADLVGKLKSCLGVGTCEWALAGHRTATAREIKGLFPKITQLVDDMKKTYTGVPLFLVGYPSIINSQPETGCSGVVGTLLDPAERLFMNESIHYLNAVLRAVAQYESIRFIDDEQAFDGERLCDPNENAMNGIRLGDDIAPLSFLENIKVIGAESFHPTPRGHQLVAQTIAAILPTQPLTTQCSGCITDSDLLTPSSYWQVATDEASHSIVEQIAQTFTTATRIMSGTTVSVSFAPGTFLPGATVSFEIHSQAHHVGSLQAAGDGSLEGQLSVSVVDESGYHVLHAYGESASAQNVDIYQTVFVDEKAEITSIGQELTGSHHTAFLATLPVGASIPNKDSEQSSPTPIQADVLGVTTPQISQAKRIEPEVKKNEEDRHRLIIATWLLFAGVAGIMAYMSIRKIVKSVIPTTLFKRIEPTGHLIESMIVSTMYGFPARKLRVIGVTGTNGKTTTSFFIQRMLSEAGIKTAITSTVAYGLDKDIHRQVEHITTAKSSILQSRLKRFAKAGAEWVVVETSSHSLAQNRVWGIPYEIAVLTNLTHDHLDYHGTFDNYREAKRKLFRIANKNGLRFGVVNADDPSAKAFADTVANSTTYGITLGDIKASNIKLTSTGSTYTATAGKDVYAISIQIPGEFNVYNSMAALAVGRKLGLTKAQIETGLAALESVEGRMNAIDEGQEFKVLVDFASTPDGFEKFFSSVRPLVKGKLIAVFGSAGRRDESKRAEQGRIAGKYADVVIATEEDDRDDDGAKILQQIAEGATESGKVEGKTLFRVSNREEAIGFAFTQASKADDMVVLLGKGHEKTIERADGEYPWNESDVARAALQELLKK